MNESQKKLCTELWRQYSPGLRNLCYVRLAGHDEDAEEIISEAFLRLCKKIMQDGSIEYPQAWLYATLDNLIKQKYREFGKDQNNVYSVSDYEEVSLPYEIDLVDEIYNEDLLEQLKDKLKTELSDEEKQLLYYIIAENKPYSEIALLMATNENAVKQRKYRLYKKIKELAKPKK